MKKPAGKITEVFSSIQGEGKYIGVKQLFIRFALCNMQCGFCDTDYHHYTEYTVEELRQHLELFFKKESFHSVSVTGGEPLLQVDFLKELLVQLKTYKQKIYLETNGILTTQLKEIIDLVDIIAMDFKLPSATKEGNYTKDHRAFFSLSRTRDCFIKIIITPGTSLAEFKEAIEIIAGVDSGTTLILQPERQAVPFSQSFFKKVTQFHRYALRYIADTRVIPQIHPWLGIK